MQVSLKFYSCVGSNHTTLDSIRACRRDGNSVDDVTRSWFKGPRLRSNTLVGCTARGISAAQLNLPYCVATLLLERNVFVDQFRKVKSPIPQAWHWQKRSRWWRTRRSPRSARNSGKRCESRSDLRDGTRWRSRPGEAPRGSEQSFATEDEIIDKFRKLTGAAMMETQQAALIEAVLEMEQLSASKRLADLLRCQ